MPATGGARSLLHLLCPTDLIEFTVERVDVIAVAVILGKSLLSSPVLVFADQPSRALGQKVHEEQLDAWHSTLKSDGHSP